MANFITVRNNSNGGYGEFTVHDIGDHDFIAVRAAKGENDKALNRFLSENNDKIEIARFVLPLVALWSLNPQIYS